MSTDSADPTDPDWTRLERPVPAWFTDAKLGIFIHWGPYSVPAWAEPTGELGAVDFATWFRHNPYAEWYFNTIRFPDSPAHEHHVQTYGGAPYDDFIDAWKAENWDPADWAALFARAGARYVVPTTKHHDGVTLWDAPGTGGRNTVASGPKRDLVGDLATAVRDAGLRYGVYYSGGLDWHVTDFPPIDGEVAVGDTSRPKDAAYAAYAYLHVQDLIDKYAPDVLWNDIDWPDAGKHSGSLGLLQLFENYYAAVPEGVVNDRWGRPTPTTRRANTRRGWRTSRRHRGRTAAASACRSATTRSRTRATPSTHTVSSGTSSTSSAVVETSCSTSARRRTGSSPTFSVAPSKASGTGWRSTGTPSTAPGRWTRRLPVRMTSRGCGGRRRAEPRSPSSMRTAR